MPCMELFPVTVRKTDYLLLGFLIRNPAVVARLDAKSFSSRSVEQPQLGTSLGAGPEKVKANLQKECGQSDGLRGVKLRMKTYS